MKIARFLHKGKERFGIVEGDHIQVAEGEMFKAFAITRQSYSLEEVKLLPPALPSKIVAVGLNYKDHAEEVKIALPDEPLLFLKPGSAVIGHLDHIIYPPMSHRVDFEGELGIVMGKTAKGVPEEKADAFILGYTCFNDVTARDLQGKDGQWTRAKGFDTFAPLGPWIETE
ncbi:MAG: fumarylacetoacetate hydrolase family protein, partial [Desulfobacterales bacterium]|nr:fumarylacetoacetate hydrolase family protein [Desulfobacterales bacterium]